MTPDAPRWADRLGLVVGIVAVLAVSVVVLAFAGRVAWWILTGGGR